MSDLTLPGAGEASGPKKPSAASFSDLPSVDRLLGQPVIAACVASHGQALVKRAINDELAAQRETVRAGGAVAPLPALLSAVEGLLAALAAPALRRVINLTGTVIHTNLGRALLAEEAIDAAAAAMRGYAALEYDLASGGRGDRDDLVEGLLFALMLMPQAVIAQSIAIAAMPTFSAQVALGRLDAMRSSLAASLRGVLLLAIPATFGLVLMRTQIVTVLYQRGEFTEFSTQLVAWALLWYAAGLVGHSLLEIAARAFYALQDTRTPVLIGAGAMALNVILSLTFAAWFTRLGWMPHGGLALANSLATAIECVLLPRAAREADRGTGGRPPSSGSSSRESRSRWPPTSIRWASSRSICSPARVPTVRDMRRGQP